MASAVGGLLGGLGSSSGSGEKRSRSEVDRTETGTQTRTPWAPQQQYLQDLWGQAAGAVGQNQPTPAMEQGWQNLLGQAESGVGGFIPQTMETAGFLGDTSLLSPETNPYLQENVTAAQNQIQEQLAQGLNLVDQQAVGSNMLGGSRQGVAQGEAIQGATQQMGDVASQMYMQNYLQGLNTLQNQQQLAPQLANLGLLPGTVQTQVGQQQMEAQNPWADLMNLSQIIQAGNWGGTTEQEGQVTGTDITTGTGTSGQQASPLQMFGQFANAWNTFA